MGPFEQTDQTIQIGAAAQQHPFLPKLSAMNSTAWEQWVFDATSDDGASGIMVGLCRDPNYAFFGQGNLHVQFLHALGDEEPTTDLVFLQRSSLFDCGGCVASYWVNEAKGYEFMFTMYPDLDAVALRITTPRVRGNLTFVGTAPGHYPDGLPMLQSPGSPIPDTDSAALVAPGLYMCNTVPGARVTGVLELDGVPLTPPFDVHGGAGMTRLWASAFWFDIVTGFRIIRASAGPYSFFFMDSGSRWDDGVTHASGVLYYKMKQLVGVRRREPASGEPGQDWVPVSQRYGRLGARGSTVGGGKWTGHLVKFFSHATNRTWRFEVEHARLYSSMSLGGGHGVDIFSNRVWGGQLGLGEDGETVYTTLYRGSAYSEDSLFPRTLAPWRIWLVYSASMVSQAWTTLLKWLPIPPRLFPGYPKRRRQRQDRLASCNMGRWDAIEWHLMGVYGSTQSC